VKIEAQMRFYLYALFLAQEDHPQIWQMTQIFS